MSIYMILYYILMYDCQCFPSFGKNGFLSDQSGEIKNSVVLAI